MKNGKNKTSVLGKKQLEILAGLGDDYARAPDAPVASVAQEARELVATLVTYGKQLQAKTHLEPKTIAAIRPRLGILEVAEAAFAAVRFGVLPSGTLATRAEGETLKREIVAALRYFVRKDKGVQGRVDAIQQGDGVADLVDDLIKLADLVDERGRDLAKSEVPKGAAARARELAALIGEGAATKPTERIEARGAADPLSLRNRAFWYLREAMDEVREAGRYLFRNDPKRLALFHASTTRAEAARAKKKAAAKTKAARKPAAPAQPSPANSHG